MMNATSENGTKKIYEMEKERALVARQLNIAKGRQALTIKKLKQQGFEVLPVGAVEEQVKSPTVPDLPTPTVDAISEEEDEKEELSVWVVVRDIGLAALSALVTKLVIDYTYPRLRALVMPAPIVADEVVRDDVWNNQSIFK